MSRVSKGGTTHCGHQISCGLPVSSSSSLDQLRKEQCSFPCRWLTMSVCMGERVRQDLLLLRGSEPSSHIMSWHARVCVFSFNAAYHLLETQRQSACRPLAVQRCNLPVPLATPGPLRVFWGSSLINPHGNFNHQSAPSARVT